MLFLVVGPSPRGTLRTIPRNEVSSINGEKLTSLFDPDFEAAKREFHALYTVEHLLHAP